MTKNDIRTKLQAKELNMRRFAEQHHYHARSVVSAIDRYAGTDKKPRLGTVTHQILSDLSTILGESVIDGLLN